MCVCVTDWTSAQPALAKTRASVCNRSFVSVCSSFSSHLADVAVVRGEEPSLLSPHHPSDKDKSDQ